MLIFVPQELLLFRDMYSSKRLKKRWSEMTGVNYTNNNNRLLYTCYNILNENYIYLNPLFLHRNYLIIFDLINI